tara:strand:+ start:157 stop:327 length:171 start_codon:yes stop_codon:yes gene_type:complete
VRLNQFLFFQQTFPYNLNSHKFSGDNGIEETPDPIPNSEVKLYSADGTAWETSVGE